MKGYFKVIYLEANFGRWLVNGQGTKTLSIGSNSIQQ